MCIRDRRERERERESQKVIALNNSTQLTMLTSACATYICMDIECTYPSVGGALIDGQMVVRVLYILESNDTRPTNMNSELGKLTTPTSTLDITIPDPEGLV